MFLHDIVAPLTIDEAKATKTRLDPKCWAGKKIGNPKTKVKGGVRVNNCVPANEDSNMPIANDSSSPVGGNVKETIGPDKNDPWEKGWRAGFRQNEFNPYPAGSNEAKQWDDGYAEAEAQPNHYDEGIEHDMPDLESVGEPVRSIMDAERRMSAGDRIFVAHEMDDEPFEIFDVGDLKGYTYDQMLAVPQDIAEGNLEANTLDPVVVIQDLKGKILDKINLSVAAKKYRLGRPQNIKNQLAHQNYTTVGNYVVMAPISGQPQSGVAEGRAGVDDRDTVGFSVNSEAAYNAVMARFGDYIDHNETDGIMYAPAKLWPRIEMVAFDADGEGAVQDEGLAEVTGDKPFDNMMKSISKGTKKQAAADRKDQKTQSQQQARDAFGSMFGGGNPAGNLKIREQGANDIKQLFQTYASLYYNSREGASDDMEYEAYYDAIQQEMNQIEQQISKQYGPAGVKKLQKYGYEQYHGKGSFDDDVVRESTTVTAEADRNEMDTPEFQAAIAKMKKRHAQDDQNFNLDKARELGKKLAARGAAERKTKGVDEDSWHDGQNAWSSDKNQWSNESVEDRRLNRLIEYRLAEMRRAGYDI